MLTLLLIAFSTRSQAFDEAVQGNASPTRETEEISPGWLSLVDRTHEDLSTHLETLVKRVDSFFANDRAFEEATESYMRLRLDFLMDNNNGTEFKADVAIKIDLPQTEQRLKLLIESDPQEDIEAEDRPGESPIEALEQKNYSLALETELKQAGKWIIRPAAGVKFEVPPDPFVRLRVIRYHGISDWLMRFAGNAFWFNSEGIGGNARLDFDQAMGDHLLFRSSTFAEWKEENEFVTASHAFILYQQIEKWRTSIAYEMGLGATNEADWNITSYFLRLRYRQRIYKKWLFAEIRPEILFLEEDDFDPAPGISLRLEAVLGKRYL